MIVRLSDLNEIVQADTGVLTCDPVYPNHPPICEGFGQGHNLGHGLIDANDVHDVSDRKI